MHTKKYGTRALGRLSDAPLAVRFSESFASYDVTNATGLEEMSESTGRAE